MLDLERVKQEVERPAPAPLHAKLREALQAQIMDGTLQPGETLPSERIIRETLEISRSTIRQAISALTRIGLLQSIPSTGTFVLDRQERPPSQGLIGLIVSSANFYFFYPQVAAAFNNRLRQANYGLVTSMHNDRADMLCTVVDELLAQNIVALAVTPPRYGDADAVTARLRQNGAPFLFIGRRSDNLLVDSIATDNVKVGCQATRHLIELGHRRIVHFGFQDYSTGQDRAAGYTRAMREAGLTPYVVEPVVSEPPVSSSETWTEHLADRAYQAAQSLWQSGCDVLPTAAFCFNDITAMGVYKALRDLRRRIPEDVSLVSVDNLITIRHFEVPLTTFALPGEQIGWQGAELLLRRLAGEETPPAVHLLPAQFIKRMSTAHRAA